MDDEYIQLLDRVMEAKRYKPDLINHPDAKADYDIIEN